MSPSGSLAAPVKENGVEIGIVKLDPILVIIGALFPVAVCTAQLLPFAKVEKLTISSKLAV